MRRPLGALAMLLVAGCALSGNSPRAAAALAAGGRLDLVGQFTIPPLTKFPPFFGATFGGLSGLALVPRTRDVLAISDDREGSRAYILRIEVDGTQLTVTPRDRIALEVGGRAPRLDPEAIVRLRSGGMLIASEGARDPRVAPAIIEYTASGAFVRQLAIPDKFVPNDAGAQAKGVRENAGFESLTLTPRGNALFTATETALVQDDVPASFSAGSRSRIVEYAADGGSFRPRREFVYPVDAVEPVSFEAVDPVAGLVELVALSDTELLALERTFIEERGRPGHGVNRARIYRLSLSGASDVSGYESLRQAEGAVPVSKTLILDVASVRGLSPELAPSLDNFEGLSFGPPLADGTPTLLMVSDDNFSERQSTWFLLFGIRR